MSTNGVPEIWVNALGMKFKLVKPGEFVMGSPKTELRRYADEVPHSVRITRAYYLSLYPTTQAQWRAVVGENPSKNVSLKQAPVENVSWYDCADFIDKINSDEYSLELRRFLGDAWRYVFPTEAQWEFACRAGTSSPYYFGDVATSSYGNFGKLNLDDKDKTTTEVGSYPPNPWGFYDMFGNVCEWTNDYYGEYSPNQTVDPIGASRVAERTARGGSWRSVPENCRSASRFNFLSTYRGDNCGLRLAIVEISERSDGASTLDKK